MISPKFSFLIFLGKEVEKRGGECSKVLKKSALIVRAALVLTPKSSPKRSIFRGFFLRVDKFPSLDRHLPREPEKPAENWNLRRLAIPARRPGGRRADALGKKKPRRVLPGAVVADDVSL